MAVSHRRPVVAALALLVMAPVGCTPPAPTIATTAPATVSPTIAAPAKVAASPVSSPSPAAKQSASPSPSPSPAPAIAPSVSPSPSASPSPGAAAPRPSDAALRITAPMTGQTVPAGSVQVSVSYTGAALVAAASATRVDEDHLHYILDENVAPYLGTLVPVPMGNPRIVHTAATQVTFDNVPAGSHTVTVMLTGNNHISVRPPLSEQVTFSVSP